ncbi:hypothetical protein B0H13DRAFT_2040469, partial [Mycena leptocephala]
MSLFVGCLCTRRTLSFPGRRTVPCVRIVAPPSHASPASKGVVPPSPSPSSCGQESAPKPDMAALHVSCGTQMAAPLHLHPPGARCSSHQQRRADGHHAGAGTGCSALSCEHGYSDPHTRTRFGARSSISDFAAIGACIKEQPNLTGCGVFVPTRPTRACWASSSAGFLPVQVPVGGVAHPISVSRRSPPSPTRSRRKTLGGKGPASRCARAGRTATEAPSFAADRDTFPPCDRQSRYSVLTASSAALLRSTPVTAERAASNFHPLVR